MITNILYIGRFQPFHKGHADAVQQIFEKYFIGSQEKFHLYIGIGSAEDNFQEKNPLTAGERFEIITAAFDEMNISRENYSIIPVRNINHYAVWPHHVQQLMPKISILASGSPLVQNLWKRAFPDSEILCLEKRKDISGTQVREKIKQSENIEKFLLESVQNTIFHSDINLSDRLLQMRTD